MGMLRFDLPLNTPIVQTILPVMSVSGMMYGFIPISKTLFDNPLLPVLRAYGDPVIPTVVTLPDKADDGSNMFVPQYVALVYTLQEVSFRPWLGLPELINNEQQGYHSSWQCVPGAAINHFGRGVMLDALALGMDTTLNNPQPEPPMPVIPSVQAWAATVPLASLAKMSFFDFQWSKIACSKNPQLQDEVILRIEVNSNPVSGNFKASIVSSAVTKDAVVVFDTLRILRLANVAPGIYEFQFTIVTKVRRHSVNLTLTVS